MDKYAILIVFILSINYVSSQSLVGLENGFSYPSYIDVKIPAKSGTKMSFTKDFTTLLSLAIRLQLQYEIRDKHQIKLIVAPLESLSKGRYNYDVVFMNTTFRQNNVITANYKFNSYRLTYCYSFIDNEKLKLYMGVTGKIRDAEISLSTDYRSNKKKSFGFIPLLHFNLNYDFKEPWNLYLEGDGIIAKQGRAIDFHTAVEYSLNERIKIKAGYRILEGGSNGSSVYTFALFHYAIVGIKFSL
jgi:hypothetical protein